MKNDQEKTVQEKMAKLRELTAWFDSDEFVLEQAMSRFKEAEQLAKEIHGELDAVQNDITIAAQSFEKEV